MQRKGRNKDTQIDQSYIESGEFRKKFDLITDDKDINRLLYICAKKMLYHRSGSLQEDMYWIDANSKQIVAKELDQIQEQKVIYSKKTRKKINKQQGLITIHTHPSSSPPSVGDFNSNYRNKYSLGVVCGHDGKVFIYTSHVEIPVGFYAKKVEYYRKLGYNDYEAQIETIKSLSNVYNIKCKEVTV